MQRKEIFFKNLCFVIGVLIVLSFIEGKEIPLPIRSELRLSYGQRSEDGYRNELIIKQEGEIIHITFLSDELVKRKYFVEQGIREGIIPISEFMSFWDSLNSFDFWQLQESYTAFVSGGEIAGVFSVSLENEEGIKITKNVRFSPLKACPEGFKIIYELLQGMIRYAQVPPNLTTLLKFENTEKELWGRAWYQELANAEIGRIKDPKYLDTLIYLLPREKKFTEAIITALRNIGEKNAIPALVKVLKQEVKKKELDDETTSSIIQALSELTGQNYPYNPSDSLEVKKKNINKWINWWKENKDKFK